MNPKHLKISERYEDLGLLGKGGMGEVRCVFDQMLGRTVAMKTITVTKTKISESNLARFIEEAQVSSRLQHPNILPVHDLGQLPDGRFYFTMKIAEGESLKRRIQRLHQESTCNRWVPEGAPHSLRRLLSALKQVGDALAYAHSKGLIHRDLKPLNIIIGDHGSVQLLDWGIAKRLKHYFTEWVKEIEQFEEEDADEELFDEISDDLLQTKDQLEETKITIAAVSGRGHKDTQDQLEEPQDQLEESQDQLEVERLTFGHPLLSQINYDIDYFDETPLQLGSISLPNITTPPSSVNLDRITDPSIQLVNTSSAHEHSSSELGELKRFSVSSEELISLHISNKTTRTTQGEIAGTLHYMAPEQLRGDVDLITCATDVFGLGAVLYELLTSTVPFPFKLTQNKNSQQLITDKIQLALERRAQPLQWPTDAPPIPKELKTLCEHSLVYSLENRLPTAAEFTERLINYLDGVGRREKALTKVKEAEKLFTEASRLQKYATQVHAEGEAMETQIKPSDPEEVKYPTWKLLDHAAELREEAHQLKHEAERTLYDSLLFDGTLSEAHSLLATRALEAHRYAEDRSQHNEVRRQEVMIRQHLPFADRSISEKIKTYLSPVAPVTLLVNAPLAPEVRVYLQRYVERGRRLHLTPREPWGTAPLIARPTPLGRYLLTIEADGYESVHYPMIVERERGWSSTPPDATDPEPIVLLPLGHLPSSFQYVPSGWFYAGGDPLVSNSTKQKRRLWLDGFILAVKHITHREYLAFLNNLLSSGDFDRAYSLRPRLRDEEGEGLYSFTDREIKLNESEFAKLDWPANYTDYEGALAYIEWRAQRDQLPYRPPADMEWEKVARGVDARLFPWGDIFDPSFAHMRLSQLHPQPDTPERWSADQSPWGHLALSGSMRDWTSTLFEDPFPYEDETRVSPPSKTETVNLKHDRVVRGGSWKTLEGNCRVACRFVATPKYRDDDGSFRLACSVDHLLKDQEV